MDRPRWRADCTRRRCRRQGTPVRAEVNGESATFGPIRSLHHYALATRDADHRECNERVRRCARSRRRAPRRAIPARSWPRGSTPGSYRHAEVSLLLSWFRDHPEARTLPAKSIVLSTLTPCRQCTRYLSLAKAPDTLIRFDEADAGRSGRVGERIAEPIGTGGDRRFESVPVSAGTGTAREAERRAIRNDGEGGVSRIDRAREARRVILGRRGRRGRPSTGRRVDRTRASSPGGGSTSRDEPRRTRNRGRGADLPGEMDPQRGTRRVDERVAPHDRGWRGTSRYVAGPSRAGVRSRTGVYLIEARRGTHISPFSVEQVPSCRGVPPNDDQRRRLPTVRDP